MLAPRRDVAVPAQRMLNRVALRGTPKGHDSTRPPGGIGTHSRDASLGWVFSY